MTRTRNSRSRPEDLAESWDDMGDSYEGDSLVYEEEEERDEVGEEYRPRMNGSHTSQVEPSRRRNLRSSVEPELVVPASPNAAAARIKAANKQRASTPHMRMNQRSLTSDAGEIRRKTRSSTPRQRMGDRSMTGDAGRFQPSRLSAHDEAEYDSDEDISKASLAWERIARPVLAYVFGVVGMAFRNLQPLLAYGLIIYIVVAAFVFASGFVSNSINNALSPICRLPFTSHLAFCPDTRQELQGSAEFDKLVQAQDAFQDVLASSSTGANLPWAMKRSEAGIRDLKHVVEYATLPSKNELVFEFNGFIETARQASQDLGKFNSRIGRAVDHILSTNRWTLSVIDGVKTDEASQGAVTRWVYTNLNIFAPFQPLSLSRDVLLDQYLRHTSAVEEQIQSLISEAIALRDILENLDGRLDVISGIVTRDGIKVAADKDELFATLWTKLGGNRASIHKIDQKLQLLNDMSSYRHAAWDHITSTLLKLQEIQNSLEDLRERVAMPQTIGTDKVPLEVHLESINLGIERLEQQRDASRKIEQDNYQRIMAKGEAGDRKMLREKAEL